MKQFNRKSSALALVRPAPIVEPHEEEKAAALRESFAGWLGSVAPTLLRSPAKHKPSVANGTRRSLTSTDIIRVNRATVRESTTHRHWPPEVVLSFLEADVITRTRKP
ncbi:MAG TPA: hypothetical protein VGO73_10365 [Pyrinomonadaceae bacterium]|nr:hypothetical protein [Pyrinomonadaceae bacterium]